MINTQIINECTTLNLPFPKMIQTLSEIGIERYYTDLIRLEKTYYSHSDESYVEPMLIENLPALANNFDKINIIDAIKSSQAAKIDYHTFIKRIIAAGAVSYTVYLNSKQVIYTGRTGESHIEKFHF